MARRLALERSACAGGATTPVEGNVRMARPSRTGGHCRMEELTLSDNRIGERDDHEWMRTCGSALAAAVERNRDLRVLDLTFNHLSAAAKQALVDANARRDAPLALRL